MLSARFALAIAKGRSPVPATRPALLATLLRKRATAHALGDAGLETLLRDQIRWALPIERSEPADA